MFILPVVRDTSLERPQNLLVALNRFHYIILLKLLTNPPEANELKHLEQNIIYKHFYILTLYIYGIVKH